MSKQFLKKVKIINYLINPIKLNELLDFIFIKRKNRYICVSNVHSCLESYFNPKFKIAHNSSDLAIPDGRPIFWALKLLGYKNIDHLPGYFITKKICEISVKKKYKIGFFGSTSSNLKKLKFNLEKEFNGLKIDFIYSPPFMKNIDRMKLNFVKEVNKRKIDILFVCLGCPKQELWMFKNKNKVNSTMLGIGAAADFLSGNKLLPNKFFEFLGLAWLIRLITEPRRLFWRYFSTNFLFIFLFFLQIMGLKKFK